MVLIGRGSFAIIVGAMHKRPFGASYVDRGPDAARI